MIGTFAHIDALVEAAELPHADVAVGFTPPRDASSLLQWRTLHDAGTALLFLSTYPDERDTLCSAIAGAAGFVTQLVRTPEIVSSIVDVANGAVFPLSPAGGTWLHPHELGAWHLNLNEREQAVVGAALKRRKTPEIAVEVGCSEDDVRSILCDICNRIRS